MEKQDSFEEVWNKAKPGTTFTFEINATMYYIYKPSFWNLFKFWLIKWFKFRKKNYILVGNIK